MCGITGGWWINPSDEIDKKLQQSLKDLETRGPNDSGYELISLRDTQLAIGHTRLSVIDLSEAGHQPMKTDDGRYSLTFNGEIYNYIELRDELKLLGVTFSSNSDTEVLLKSWVFWGQDCLSKLDGMFAFVIFDSLDSSLYCVRDAFGVKPFFYEISSEKFIFSSVIPSLLKLKDEKPRPNLQRAYQYLVHSEYDSNSDTFIEGVKQLKPAELLHMTVGKPETLVIKTWWKPEKIKQREVTFDNAVLLVREAFLKNIKRQLRSDVPLGVALSGGVDSSAVVCAIRKILPQSIIHTFSYISQDEKTSEEVWVDKIVDHVGAQSHKIVATSDELAVDLEALIRAQGEPFGSTSIYAQYRVFMRAKEAEITVTLDGQGADELLAGYEGYPGYRIKSFLDKAQFVGAYHFIMNWAKWPNRSVKLALMSYGRVVLPQPVYHFFRNLTGHKASPSWLNRGFLEAKGVVMVENRIQSANKNRGARVTDYLKSSIGKRGLPGLLRHADRNAMNFSIESRVPFLSVEFAELLLSLPEEYLISVNGETKSVFRAAMRGIVPDEVLDRRDKIGFATPEKDWLLGMTPKLRKWLSTAGYIPFINKTELLGEFDKITQGKKKFSWQVWRWVNYCQWYALYIGEE